MFHPRHIKMQSKIESAIMSLLIMVLLYHSWVVISKTDIFYSRKHQPKQIFILAGQSNMAGRGGVRNRIWDGFVPRESQPNSAILRLDAELNWVKAREPLHADIDANKTCGIGPGMVFANSVLRRSYNKVIGLRHDLQMPNIPFIQIALASGQDPFVETVREAQLRVDLPNVLTIDAKGFPLEPDRLHLSTPAHVLLGEIMAQAFSYWSSFVHSQQNNHIFRSVIFQGNNKNKEQHVEKS